MVVSLGPGKFYGSGLPRPRFYTDIRFNSERVDPPVPVLDPLLSWANEAHWSMGGLSFNRLRLQGRIEGNVQKLRSQREKTLSEKEPTVEKNRAASLSTPPAPMAVKRRSFLNLIDESEDDSESENKDDKTPVKRVPKRVLWKGPVRKLGDDFERVANDKYHNLTGKGKRSFSDLESDEEPIMKKTKKVLKGLKKMKTKKVLKGLKKSKDEVQGVTGTRTRSSPRLAK